MIRGVQSQKLRAAVIETLEDRRLMSLTSLPHYDLAPNVAWSAGATTKTSSSSTFAAQKTGGATLLALQPMVTSSNPANGAVDIPRFAPLTMTVQLADSGAGIDPATLNLTNVRVRRTSDNQFINANINTDAAGAAITIQPTALLASFTQYTISVTSSATYF